MGKINDLSAPADTLISAATLQLVNKGLLEKPLEENDNEKNNTNEDKNTLVFNILLFVSIRMVFFEKLGKQIS